MDGPILIVLTLGMLIADQHMAPYFPFLFLFQLGLSLAACHELVKLLGPQRAPQAIVCYFGVAVIVLANWYINYPEPRHSLDDPVWNPGWIPVGRFLYEVATFTAPGRSVERMALTWLILGYVGLLPCFFAQVRWLTQDQEANSFRLALAAFVPKCCDIGAYAAGRLFGRHKMTPILSPRRRGKARPADCSPECSRRLPLIGSGGRFCNMIGAGRLASG